MKKSTLIPIVTAALLATMSCGDSSNPGNSGSNGTSQCNPSASNPMTTQTSFGRSEFWYEGANCSRSCTRQVYNDGTQTVNCYGE